MTATLLTCKKCHKDLIAYVPCEASCSCGKPMKASTLTEAEAKKLERQFNQPKKRGKR